MRILLYSHWFSPSIGGVETVSKILAEQFVQSGAKVTVVTSTPGPEINGDYKVVRQAGRDILRNLAAESDIILQNTISLRTMLPFAMARRPIVVTHQSWLRRPDGTRGMENYIKLLTVHACHNVSISSSIAASLPVASEIIPNPFEPEEFQAQYEAGRGKDIVFMGRLIPEKGCDLLLQALAKLKSRNIVASLSIIGDGAQANALKAMTIDLGLSDQVQFLGGMSEGRGAVVSRHKIMAIPSRWAEPFGIVALEGIASGCAVVASEQGGLKEAVGPCGLYFQNGDIEALTETLGVLLTDEALRRRMLSDASSHLQKFQPHAVADRYLELFKGLVSKKTPSATRNESRA